jgi:hypothetical protein
VEPSDGFLGSARQNLAGRAVLHKGAADLLPLEDRSVDVVVFRPGAELCPGPAPRAD